MAFTSIMTVLYMKATLSMARKMELELLHSPIRQEFRHFGNQTTFKVEVRSSISMVITMKDNFIYHKKTDVAHINGLMIIDTKDNSKMMT